MKQSEIGKITEPIKTVLSEDPSIKLDEETINDSDSVFLQLKSEGMTIKKKHAVKMLAVTRFGKPP